MPPTSYTLCSFQEERVGGTVLYSIEIRSNSARLSEQRRAIFRQRGRKAATLPPSLTASLPHCLTALLLTAAVPRLARASLFQKQQQQQKQQHQPASLTRKIRRPSLCLCTWLGKKERAASTRPCRLPDPATATPSPPSPPPPPLPLHALLAAGRHSWPGSTALIHRGPSLLLNHYHHLPRPPLPHIYTMAANTLRSALPSLRAAAAVPKHATRGYAAAASQGQQYNMTSTSFPVQHTLTLYPVPANTH